MFKKIYFYPSKNLVVAIPVVLVTGFLLGYFFDLSFLKKYILWATFLMIYPTMIGFKLSETVSLTHLRVLGWSLVINFVLIPLLAYLLGLGFFTAEPQLFAGLAIASLLPTSGMTISWTMLSKGNVPAAIKLTVISLVLGSLLAPWYLLAMVGKYVPINIVEIFKTIVIVVVSPLILGNITHRLLIKKYSPERFQKELKPLFPAASVWAMLFVIFSSISMKAKMILSQPELLLISLVALVVFYLANFLVSTLVGRWTMDRADSFALVYGTVMRNLSISLGIAVTAFGAKAALIVTLAFIIQVQGAAWYGKLAQKYSFFPEKGVKMAAPVQEA
jgi:ACR3 family arsenite efflux pump ArsB